jgi:predicted ATP-dependent serine protease
MDYKSRIQKYKDTYIDPAFFETYRTETPIDMVLSEDGGLLKAFIYMLTGDAGCGKSTVVLDLLANLLRVNPDLRILFVSAEMNKYQLMKYMKRFPKCKEIDILYVKARDNTDDWTATVAVLSEGYDVVAIDSIVEMENVISKEVGASTKEAENLFLSEVMKHAEGVNDRGALTSFILVQQFTKGGTFLGANRLIHDVDGSIVLRKEGESRFSPRYLMFTKHRGGDSHERLYYDLTAGGDIIYDGERLERERKLHQLQADDARSIRNAADSFTNFSFNQDIDEQ